MSASDNAAYGKRGLHYANVAIMSLSLTTMYCLSSSPANSVPLYLEYKTVLPLCTLGATISSVFSSTLPLPTATTYTRTADTMNPEGQARIEGIFFRSRVQVVAIDSDQNFYNIYQQLHVKKAGPQWATKSQGAASMHNTLPRVGFSEDPDVSSKPPDVVSSTSATCNHANAVIKSASP